MNLKTLIFFVLFIPTILSYQYSIAYSKTFPYVSPGLRIGFGKGVNISLKISFGINTDYELGHDSKYYNLTIGFKVPFLRKAENSYEKYKFIEVQAGYKPFPEENLLSGMFFGGGLGFMFYKENNKTKYCPMATVDFGPLFLWGFYGFDLVFLEYKEINTDFGILWVMPIPLKKLPPLFD